ncbi:MAG: hypothetical protein IJV65_03960 [Kiritimatiellae bacterium]|nr:hypothetical protein [Kiritimatiellia bacterium]
MQLRDTRRRTARWIRADRGAAGASAFSGDIPRVAARRSTPDEQQTDNDNK